jgi:hypothetical protein
MVRGDKLPNVGNLSASVLYTLAAPSTPDEVRTEVEERVAAGESISLADVKRLKEEWSNERRTLKQQIAIGSIDFAKARTLFVTKMLDEKFAEICEHAMPRRGPSCSEVRPRSTHSGSQRCEAPARARPYVPASGNANRPASARP